MPTENDIKKSLKKLFKKDSDAEEYKWAVNELLELHNNSHKVLLGDLYWEKAFFNYVYDKKKKIHPLNTASSLAETLMDIVYLAANAMNVAFPFIAMLPGASAVSLIGLPIVGIVWNGIDTLGAGTLAARDYNLGDKFSAGVNIASGLQLSLGTTFYAFTQYASELGLSSLLQGLTAHLGANGVSALGVVGCGVTFAAAMAFSWYLAQRELTKCQHRVTQLDLRINILKNTIFHEPDTLNQLKEFRNHQHQQIEGLQRAVTAWKFCTFFMSAVAAVSLLAVACGASTVTFGLALPVAAAILTTVVSAVYRLFPRIPEVQKLPEPVLKFFSVPRSNNEKKDSLPETNSSSTDRQDPNAGNKG